MKMSQANNLRSLLQAAAPSGDAGLFAPDGQILWRDAIDRTILGGRRRELAGKSALIGVSSQFQAALAMLELDGLVERMVIAPPDFTVTQLTSAIVQSQIDAVICDDPAREFGVPLPRFMVLPPSRDEMLLSTSIETQWGLPTSGTTGEPKLVGHRLAGLLGPLRGRGGDERAASWSTFYDIRRYGGMQILLRAIVSGAKLVLTHGGEPLGEHVARMAEAEMTHLSGTPSHWRRLLMSGEAARISPNYIRLSGEIADGAILDALAEAFPQAKIVHAYASTEAGVGFEVTDGREGFPASYLGGVGDVEICVVDGALRIRSLNTASAYIGRADLKLLDENGYVDTDDLVERRGDRFYFKGRRAGTINVGGLKVHPEEVEQVINAHDAVRMCLVKARRNPILGDLIVAQVVLKEDSVSPERKGRFKEEILTTCRNRLERHMAPVSIDFVPSLAMSAAGKILRGRA